MFVILYMLTSSGEKEIDLELKERKHCTKPFSQIFLKHIFLYDTNVVKVPD